MNDYPYPFYKKIEALHKADFGEKFLKMMHAGQTSDPEPVVFKHTMCQMTLAFFNRLAEMSH